MFCFWNRPGQRDRHMSIYTYKTICIICITPVHIYSLPEPDNLSTMRETKRLLSELFAPWKLEHVKLVCHHCQDFWSILKNLNETVLNYGFCIDLAKNMYFVTLCFADVQWHPKLLIPTECLSHGILWRTWVSPGCKFFLSSFPQRVYEAFWVSMNNSLVSQNTDNLIQILCSGEESFLW